MASSNDIAGAWLSEFAISLASGDISSVTQSFLPQGWLRDVLVLSWSTRSLGGHSQISKYLSEHLPNSTITDVKLDERDHLKPEEYTLSPSISGVAAAFTFETSLFLGRGYFRLLEDSTTAKWKALSVFIVADDLKGYEERGYHRGIFEGHTLAWEEAEKKTRARVENDPQVVIIGGGQTGLQVAARFKQMNIPTVVLENNYRIGDNWRQRYPTLYLHTPRTHHTLLYQPYPRNWPMYTPRDKFANWLEQYATSQDIIVWTNSRIALRPLYDDEEKHWDITVDKNGVTTQLYPKHIVVCAGTLGSPNNPTFQGQEQFSGEIFHASKFMGALPYARKQVVVVGGGNTAVDLCQDLVTQGAQSVTMVVRSATCAVTEKTAAENTLSSFPEGVPTELCDFKVASMPNGLLRTILIENETKTWERNKDLHDGLRKAGMKLTQGSDGSGLAFIIFDRFGGTQWIDMGCGELISSGKVKIKQDVEIKRFLNNGIIFSDDSEIEADAVILATGYHNIRDTMRDLFGSDIIDRTHEVWGLDDEDELRGVYRPSGQPGLWFAAGELHASRFSSKRLAIQIKAIELGLMSE